MKEVKSRVYKKIALLELHDKCDGTNILGDLAAEMKITPTYLKTQIKLATYRPSERVRELLAECLKVSSKVIEDHFEKAKRKYKEDRHI